MIYKESTITLKNGQLCLLRSPMGEDAEGMIAYLRKTSGETPYMARYEDEVNITVQEECEFLSKILDDRKQVMIAAFIDGKLIANAGLSKVSLREKHQHRAEFGISIIKEYWNAGLGSALLSAIIEAAEAVGFEQIELDVVTENERAIALYKKYGFEIYGTRERSFKLRDGTYISEYLMLKKLK